MATYNADIRIGVVGKAQLNQLEAQFKRINKQVEGLQKAVKLQGLNQRLRLDTRAATTAVDTLQRKINQLNRTVTVNANARIREQREGSGGGGGGGGASALAPIAIAPAAVSASRELVRTTDQIGQNLQENNRAIRGMEQLNARRLRIAEDLKSTEAEKNALIQEQARLIRNVATVEASRNEQARRANQNRLFGGEVSKAGNPLSPLQAQSIAEGRIQTLGRSIGRLNGQIAEQRAGYEQVARSVNQLDAAERRRASNALSAMERIDQRNEQSARRRRRLGAAGRGAFVGGGAAAFSIPGLGGISAGALGGAQAGGPLGAVAGAATAGIIELGAALTSYGNEAAKAAIETDLFRKALLGVVGGNEYYTALREIDGITRDFNADIINTTENFTKLAAATRANGVDAAETAEVYRGLAAANTALGGNAERLNGILLAAGQVFSKGKVQAEELRGQIGERLPGAFALFARSVGLSTAELDKALEQGKISTEDFVNFTKFLYEQYKDDAAAIANSPEAAAARLEVSLKALQISVGNLLKPIRTSWLETADFIVLQLTRISNAINSQVIAQQEGQIRLLRFQRAAAVEANDFGLAQELQDKINAARDVLNQLKYPLDGQGQPLGQKPGGATGESDADREKREKQEAKAEARRQREEARRQKLVDLAKSDQILAQGLLELEQQRQALTEDQIAKNELLLQYQSDRRRIFINVLDEERRAIELRNLELKLARDFKVLQNDELDRRKEITEESRKYLESIYKLQVGLSGFTGELQKSNTELGVGLQLANDLGNQLTQTFGDLITSTDKWTDSLRNALGQLASLLLKAGFNALGGGDGRGLFSFLSGNLSNSGGGSINPGDFLLPGAQRNFAGAAFPARANGGPVSRGRAYRVGEEGPEIFVPGSNGSIQQGGSPVVSNITVNITGDSEETDSTQSSELGRMIEASVVGVINRERRPGGLLTR